MPSRRFFQDDEIQTDLIMAGGVDARVLAGDGPGRSVADRVPLVMAGRAGTSVWFCGGHGTGAGWHAGGLHGRLFGRDAGRRLRVRVTSAAGRPNGNLWAAASGGGGLAAQAAWATIGGMETAQGIADGAQRLGLGGGNRAVGGDANSAGVNNFLFQRWFGLG